MDVGIGLCAATIKLGITANETGTWLALIEFNGAQFSYAIPVVNGQPVEIPNKLNENYAHTLKLYNTSGQLFNNTCYTLRTQVIICQNCDLPVITINGIFEPQFESQFE